MTADERINLAELRKWAEPPVAYVGYSQKQIEVLALVEAVEAARHLYERVQMDESVGIGLSERASCLNLGAILSRFDFGEAQP